MADDLCQEAMKYIPVTILRFFNIYGSRMNEDSGSIFYQFLKGSRVGEILVYGTGESQRDFINVKDIAKIVSAATARKWIGQIVDIGTGKGTAIADVAELFALYGESKLIYDRSKKEIAWTLPDTRKLIELYGPISSDLIKDIREMVENDGTN